MVFEHTIRVRWSDCDPARIAYTGRISYFALEAIDAWWESTVDDDWFRLNIDRNIGVPFVHLSIDFRSPVTPRHLLLCTVSLVKLGNSSVGFDVVGKQDGTICFEGNFVEAFVSTAERHSMPVPEDIRARLQSCLTTVPD